jgi:hypothetical protein
MLVKHLEYYAKNVLLWKLIYLSLNSWAVGNKLKSIIL